MKLNFLLALSLPIAIYAQESQTKEQSASPYSSGSSKVEKFENKSRLYKDWSVSVGGGAALIQAADLTSVYDGKINPGWNAYISLDKQITHAFGLSLQYQMGHTNQKGKLSYLPNPAEANTKYNQISLLGDVNLSNLFRRVDNHSPYRWALHAYLGVGFQGYETRMSDTNGGFMSNGTGYNYTKYPFALEQKLGLDSFFFQGGFGLAYNVSKLIDIQARVMYIITGDESFDGGGTRQLSEPYNQLSSMNSDNLVIANLGLSFKLGKNQTHLKWHDPLQNAYGRVLDLQNREKELLVCKKGDVDNDGVCDDWDRQLDTPAGARVDGAGVALDMDLDGVIDLYDKCVTVPGPVENEGCPTK